MTAPACSPRPSAVLLKKALVDLPSLLTATVEGKPSFDKETSEIALNINIQADTKAYGEFVKKLEPLLKQVSLTQASTLLKGKAETVNRKVVPWPLVNNDHPELGGPPLKSKSQWCIWVNSFNNASHDSLRWNGYVVDCDPLEIVQLLESPFADDFDIKGGRVQPSDISRPSNSKTLVRIMALDKNGELVSEDQFELLAGKIVTSPYGSSGGQMPFLRHITIRKPDGKEGLLSYSTVTGFLANRERNNSADTVNLYLAPYAFVVKGTAHGWSAFYQPQQTISRRMKVTLDELKNISQIKCEVLWQPDAAAR